MRPVGWTPLLKRQGCHAHPCRGQWRLSERASSNPLLLIGGLVHQCGTFLHVGKANLEPSEHFHVTLYRGLCALTVTERKNTLH